MVDEIFSDWNDQEKFKALISSQTLLDSSSIPLYGAKPLTYMNLSGDSVSKIVQFYKLDPKRDILVISDDIDMEFAKVRFRKQGNHG